MKKIILYLYLILITAAPLLFYPKTSELFEFNKIILLYIITISVATVWAIEMIIHRKIIFKRSLLDIPLVVFIASQIISTLTSIDQRTSIFGYYSRFNGGLLSVFCYALLYWAFVSHITKNDIRRIVINLFFSSSVAAIWGIFEHFGHSPSCLLITGNFDVGCWVQDVQLRVFATFGQPNWMAAWMVAIIPLAMSMVFEVNKRTKVAISSIVISSTLFACLLFTKSKSGLGGFVVAMAVFALTLLYFKAASFKKIFSKNLFILMFIFICAAVVFGTPFTPSLSEMNKSTPVETQDTVSGTALETGGTDSGIIRTIVWKGAIDVWRQFPVFGSGVETFAFSYYRGRPLAHNNVSEWNFLYNKAHNEYLNYLATTGIVGFLSYMALIGFILKQMWNVMRKRRQKHDYYLAAALFAGFCSILVTDFFGFSVVPISLLFFLFPALSFSLSSEKEDEKLIAKPEGMQITLIVLVLFAAIVSLSFVFNYWRADYVYARADEAKTQSNFTDSIKLYREAISLAPSEALYHATLGSLYADLTSNTATESALLETFSTATTNELTTATSLSPQNVRILKSVANSYATLGDVNTSFLFKTLELTQELQVLAPTDPSILYQQCLTYAKLGRFSDAITTGEKAVEMKHDYKIARRLLAFLYEHTKQPQKAKEHLEYILKYISPQDTDVQKELSSLNSK